MSLPKEIIEVIKEEAGEFKADCIDKGYIPTYEHPYIAGATAWAERMEGFTEWASQYYTYVENNKWDGDNDETFTTSELLTIYIEQLKKGG